MYLTEQILTIFILCIRLDTIIFIENHHINY